ncbi:hypothetical protein GCM10010198_77460 [Nocardia seriolae]|nr:hypothetical protein NSER024013_22150 [Nocardia seriolae]GEM25956.1 hypothetical protein NS2_41950 [Nocardia seriolae NBRC 15557]
MVTWVSFRCRWFDTTIQRGSRASGIHPEIELRGPRVRLEADALLLDGQADGDFAA